MYAFEKLEVWKRSKSLVKIIYEISINFPKEEKIGLTSQIKRASISVCSNIAEGSSRWGKKDQARFYEIAFGSLIEILNQLIICQDLGYITQKELEMVRPEINSIGRMLDSLRKSALSKENPKNLSPFNLSTTQLPISSYPKYSS